jgi:hypothetical protein
VQADDGVVLEQDLLVCRVQVMLTRPSHMAPGFNPDSIKGKAALVRCNCKRGLRETASACFKIAGVAVINSLADTFFFMVPAFNPGLHVLFWFL